MSHNRPDLITCNKRPGPTIGMLCDNCEGRCVICDSHIDLEKEVHICGECSFGELKERCIVCAGPATHKAYYCHECVLLGRDRDGCPRVVNVAINRNDRTYERKRITIVPENNKY